MFVITMLLRKYWAYIALLALVAVSVVLVRRNALLGAEIDRQLDRIAALKAKERLRNETKHASDDDLIDGIMRKSR